ncbi:MAG: ArsB/NhaD family transporter [Bacillaceae bacterium]|nr:ArsB/NhaD family transporter [Bacillaceae bacterium]
MKAINLVDFTIKIPPPTSNQGEWTLEHSYSSDIVFYAYLALFIFGMTYLLIILETKNRTVMALAGAVVMLITGIVELERAFRIHIEWGTITLLISMMIMVSIANWSGVFHYLSIKAAKQAKGEPAALFIRLMIFTAVGSALLDNVTTVLLIVPITLTITRLLNLNPFPFLLSEIFASNIGGMATLIGDPPNIMIGGANPHLTFNDFLIHLSPAALMIFVFAIIYLYVLFGHTFVVNKKTKSQLMQINEKDYIKDAVLMRKSLIVMALTLLGFIVHDKLGLEAPVIAAAGAVLLMLWAVDDKGIEDALVSVEWGTIFFFGGLFVLVGGLVDTGVIKELALFTLDVTEHDIPMSALMILWVSGLASGIVDNIPFVATMIPLIQDMGDGLGLGETSLEMSVLWWALSLGACLGGNATLIGSSANVIVAGMAMRESNAFSFVEFVKVGFPLTVISLVIATFYLYIRYFSYL